MNKDITEIKLKLRQQTPSYSKAIAKAYMGGRTSKLNFLGLKVPQINSVVYSQLKLSELPTDQAIKVVSQLWNSSATFEEMSFVLLWFKKNIEYNKLPKHFKLLQSWVNKLDNWAHSDSLSDLFAKILEQETASAYRVFQVWNKSKNPWKRRQSVVSLLYYSGLRTKTLPYKKLICLVESILDDEDFYVQKGVGWTLREIYNVYPQKTLQYITKNIHRIPSAGYTACTEKLSPKDKKKLKKIRLKRRSNQR